MGMFDWYEPVPDLPCPVCGGAVQWQGKDGPCALLLWRQGEACPIEQRVDEPLSPDDLVSYRLPSTFGLYGECSRLHPTEAVGETADGIWTSSRIVPVDSR
jgi:hypothetical protein